MAGTALYEYLLIFALSRWPEINKSKNELVKYDCELIIYLIVSRMNVFYYSNAIRVGETFGCS